MFADKVLPALILYIYRVAERRVNLVIFIKNKLSVNSREKIPSDNADMSNDKG